MPYFILHNILHYTVNLLWYFKNLMTGNITRQVTSRIYLFRYIAKWLSFKNIVCNRYRIRPSFTIVILVSCVLTNRRILDDCVSIVLVTSENMIIAFPIIRALRIRPNKYHEICVLKDYQEPSSKSTRRILR